MTTDCFSAMLKFPGSRGARKPGELLFSARKRLLPLLWRSYPLWACFMLLIGAPILMIARAQTSFGTVVGVVTDPSGAVVPGATVILTSTDKSSAYHDHWVSGSVLLCRPRSGNIHAGDRKEWVQDLQEGESHRSGGNYDTCGCHLASGQHEPTGRGHCRPPAHSNRLSNLGDCDRR